MPPPVTGPCAIPVGDVMVNAGAFTFTGDAMSCTGNVEGTEVSCSSGAASVQRTVCADGYAFTIVSGQETLLLRVQGGSDWNAGAQFVGAPPLNGNLTLMDVGPPDQLQPPAGTMEKMSFVLQGTTEGQGVVLNGQLSTTW